MDLPTYTNIWRIEKRLYKLYDFRLPMPLPVGTFGVALGIFLIWVVLLSILNAPFDFGNGWHLVLWVVPPGVITVLATRPVIEGKRLTELLLSQARFFTEPRVMTRLAPEYEPGEVRVSVRVWHRHPDAGPLPLPRRRTEAEHGAQEAQEEHAHAAEESADRTAGEAPPLHGVAVRAEAAPLRQGGSEEPRAQAEPEPAGPDTAVHTPQHPGTEDRSERVPAFATAAPAPEAASETTSARSPGRSATASAVHDEHQEAESRSFTHTPADPDPPRDRRGLGRKVLNYFGFGLEPGPSEPYGDGGRGDGAERAEETAAGRTGDAERSEEPETDGFDAEPVFATEEDETRDRDAWVDSLRSSSGHTPVGLTAKSAYTTSDTGPMSSEELAEAAARHEERRSSAPARRLRGRTQGIRVTRELDERRTRDEQPETPAAEHAAGPGHAPQRGTEPAPERPRARGRALPAEAAPAEAHPAEAPASGTPAEAEHARKPKRRPHAAPWELDRDPAPTADEGSGTDERGTDGGGAPSQDGYADLSDYAARFAEATGRPAAETHRAPWLPPASGAPTEETEPGAAPRDEHPAGDTDGTGDAAKGAERATGSPAGASVPADAYGPRDAHEAGSAPDDAANQDPGEAPGDGRSERAARGSGEAADTAGGAGTRPEPKPALELDHGTGEHDAMPLHPHEDPDAHGPEWAEHMSVLDRHLSKADTPPPPRPKFADAPGTEREPEHPGAAAWFEDGTHRHPDQPRVGDRGNPVISARELRSRDRKAAESSEAVDAPAEAAGSAGRDAYAGAVESTGAGAAAESTGTSAETGVSAGPAETGVSGTSAAPAGADAPAGEGELSGAAGSSGTGASTAHAGAAESAEPVDTGAAAASTGAAGIGAPGEVTAPAGPVESVDAEAAAEPTATPAEAADTPGEPAGSAVTGAPAGTDVSESAGTGASAGADTPAGHAGADAPAGEGELSGAAGSSEDGLSGSAAWAAEPADVSTEPVDEPVGTTASGTGTADDEAAANTTDRADRPDTAAPKPPTQLDHGTGELASFSEVRKERSSPAAAAGTDPSHRRTAAELAQAEARALEERRHRATRSRSGADHGSEPAAGPRSGGRTSAEGRTLDRTEPPAEEAAEAGRTGTADRGVSDTHPRANPSLAGLTRHGRTDGGQSAGHTAGAHAGAEAHTDPVTARSSDPDRPDHEAPHDPHDGVFQRVAQNARRLGQLFGQPAPGEEPEPKPELELDHGTGEQERLGDTPNGVPSHRPDHPEPRPESGATRGWRRLARVVTGGAAPVHSDLPAGDIERLRTPLPGPRNLVVLGCTGGAGQTVTALMIGHTLAAHRDDRVVAVDVNPGPNGLSRRVGAQTPETLTALLANADAIGDHEQMRSYASRATTGLEIVQTLDDPYVQTLDDRDYGRLANLLGGFYGVTLMDPAATGVARALPGADGLVLVAPASADAERAVSMTFEWLDGNGYSSLRANSVLVVNGVSKRSLPDVDAAERVARGRCRAIVRVPWDDHLGASYTRIDVGALRTATKRAHGALGGVLVRALAD